MKKKLNVYEPVSAKAKFKAPGRQGQVVSSMLPVPMAAPRRATNQGGQLVGGMPVNFGAGPAKKAAPKGRGVKGARAKMY